MRPICEYEFRLLLINTSVRLDFSCDLSLYASVPNSSYLVQKQGKIKTIKDGYFEKFTLDTESSGQVVLCIFFIFPPYKSAIRICQIPLRLSEAEFMYDIR